MKFIVTLLVFFSFIYSASLKEEQIKAVYIYNFAKNIIWDVKLENYHFHIITKNKKIISFFEKLADTKKLNNKAIRVTFGKLESYIKPQLIFVDNDSIDKYESFFENYQSDKVLLVSDNFNNQRKVMINLLRTKDKKIHFEINRANILNQGLKVSDDMILLGGTEIDVAKLYKKSQDLLTKEEKKNLKLQIDIKSSQKRVNNLKKEINTQNITIQRQLKDIKKRKSKIDKQKFTISKQLKDIKNQKIDIKKQNVLLKELYANIKIQKQNMQIQQESMQRQKEALIILQKEQEKQNLEIVNRSEILQNLNLKIDEQKRSLIKKNETITTQESTISTLVILIVIIAILIIFVLLSYKKISRAKIQIETQAKDLEKAKSELEDAHTQITDSIKYASLIQHSLIPEKQSFENYFSDFFAIWEPRDVVGGDIYLFEELADDRGCILMVIDCTGHGVSGAFVTMLTKAIERQIIADIATKEISPAEILSIFNRSIKQLLRQDSSEAISNAGFDGAILYYNKKEKIVKFAGSETPLFIIQDDKLKIIKGDRHSIGYQKSKIDYEFKEHIIDVSKESVIYLTTDGYLDQTGGEKNFMFGKKRFKKLLEENYKNSFNKQKEVLIDGFYKYMGNKDKKDDLTVVGLKI